MTPRSDVRLSTLMGAATQEEARRRDPRTKVEKKHVEWGMG